MGRHRALSLLLLALSAAATRAADPPAPAPGFHPVPGNLLQNASFEHNWFRKEFTERRRFLLLQASDMGMAEADGHLDYWYFDNAKPPEIWDTTIAHSGERSIRLTGAAQGHQNVRFAGEQYWISGGSRYAEFLPMARELAVQVPKRPIVVGGWCRTQDGEAELNAKVYCATRPSFEKKEADDKKLLEVTAAFTSGTHDWEYREIKIEPEKLPGVPQWVVVSIVSKRGTAWFDDLSCAEPATEPNLLPNAGFEAAEGDFAAGWEKPALWTWFRNEYYTFTGWSHLDNKTFRGGAVLDPLLSHSGGRSLRFTVYPGDNFAVRSREIPLAQDRPHPLEVRAMVKADNLRTLELMAQDETGQWLPQGDFLGDSMENNPGDYTMGSTGSGTYDWTCVRKYFSPRKPVKSLRLYLCARGFDGRIIGKNVVGTAWLDDLQLFEHGRPSLKAAPQPQPATAALRAVDLDLGERLWGENEARLTLQSSPQPPIEASLIDPEGHSTRLKVLVTGTELRIPYTIDHLCIDWQQQYRLVIAGQSFPFGTPAEIVTTGVSSYYAYPEEPVTVFAHLNVTRSSLARLARCEIRRGSEVLVSLKDYAALTRPQSGPPGVDTNRLLQVQVKSTQCRVHPWEEPVRDNAITAALYRPGEQKPLAQTEAVSFGYLGHLPKHVLPEPIRRTAVNDRGYITVNGQPYFPVYWEPYWEWMPEANYPPRVLGLKSVDLTSIVYSKNAPPDSAVKAQLLKEVAKVKDDPKFFQYELGEGEMQLQDGAWVRRNEWLKTAAQWIREADPNHLINGPENWLVGHPGHDPAMLAFLPHFDVIGVETSFEEVPKVNQVAKPAMKEHKTAVLAGLEAYYYQTPQQLRWRGYRAVLDGASGVGLCPSGMLLGRPDRVNYLRGLNAEFRSLGPVITAEEPKDRLTVSAPQVETMERVLNGRRYVIAVRGKGTEGPLKVRFTFPAGSTWKTVKVRFEGRALHPTGDAFEDEFAAPQTVHVYELQP